LSPGSRRRRGHSLVEMVVVLATMTIVLGSIFELVHSVRNSWRLQSSKSRLQESGRRMLERVLDDVRRSGLTTFAGATYPMIWEHAAGAEASPRGNLVATMGYNDAGLVDEIFARDGAGDRITRNANRVSDEIVFQQPRDVDGNGTPLDVDGNLEWGPELVSYRVVTDSEGRPWLHRYTELAGAVVDRRIVGPSVTSITFDVVFNDRSLRFGVVDIVLYLQELDGNGQTVTASIEGAVELRNTREL
jgi:type II secretory pathway pseudopilin PulG